MTDNRLEGTTTTKIEAGKSVKSKESSRVEETAVKSRNYTL